MGLLLFKRSVKLNLCVNISSKAMDISTYPLMHLLKKSTTRWQTLYARMLSPLLQSLFACKFSLLQQLGIHDKNLGNSNNVPMNTFKNVQNIRILQIYPYNIDIRGYKTLGKFPWSRLLKPSCYLFKLNSSFIPYLEQLISIEELTIRIDFLTLSASC